MEDERPSKVQKSVRSIYEQGDTPTVEEIVESYDLDEDRLADAVMTLLMMCYC